MAKRIITFIALVFSCVSVTVPALAGGKQSGISVGEPIIYRIDNARGQNLRTILAELERQGGPKAHFGNGFGEEILQGSFIGNDWSDLFRQLLANYNYYMRFDAGNGRPKDVIIVGGGNNAQVKSMPAAIAAPGPVPDVCDGGQMTPGRMSHGPIAAKLKRACEAK